MPPASPVPGWSSGDVCRLIIATRRIDSSTTMENIRPVRLIPASGGVGAAGPCDRLRPARERGHGHDHRRDAGDRQHALVVEAVPEHLEHRAHEREEADGYQ